ncbi:Type II secretion system F domain protein [Methanolacinia petrolearia DSM 11571]|uniref:Type II secretion system F domain protein n=1 Tax=Methanolacinia petrolearia (strain DSM 11571 / OCM 486 / SEBR 4847) TaxID=679926 RepID=E1RIA7_METP4|nr:type II secretion system F family protein [Methanolacinia petrolearia]ADN36572.1 Type II secretion system F domain protein [Methanolacinia petrolearia DSM 11571]
MNSYERFCFSIFGKRAKKKREDYLTLRNDMIRARMKTPYEAYISTAYFSSIIAGLMAAILFSLITYLLRLPEIFVYKGNVPDIFIEMSKYSLILGTVFVLIISLVVVGGLTYSIFLIYPSILAGDRRRNIDSTLPYAINYITAMSTAGITPAEVFRLLGNSEIYGESAVEARYITREIDVFGKDLLDALRLAGQYTPSDRMRDFLQGAIASISSGSNLTEYFRNKSEQYMKENRQTQKTFLETLGLISESYVTALVAGTLFLIILQSIMSTISSTSSPMFLYVVIYGIIPLGSIMFVILIDAMTPEM